MSRNSEDDLCIFRRFFARHCEPPSLYFPGTARQGWCGGEAIPGTASRKTLAVTYSNLEIFFRMVCYDLLNQKLRRSEIIIDGTKNIGR
jgi:hypothetical protein